MTEFAYQRDASWWNHTKPSRRMPKYHAPVDDEVVFAKCHARIVLDRDSAMDLEAIAERQKCRRCFPAG